MQVLTSNDDVGHGTAVALADRREHRRRDRHGRLRRRHPRHRQSTPATTDMFTDTSGRGRARRSSSRSACAIVNMSLGGRTPSEPILVDAIHAAAAQGVLLVASAGNDGKLRRLARGGPPAVGRRAQLRHRRRRNGRHGPPGVLLGLGQAPLPRGARDRTAAAYAGVLVALPPREPVRRPVHDVEARTARTMDTSRARPSPHPEVAGVAALVWAAQPGPHELPGGGHPQAVRDPDRVGLDAGHGLRHPRRRRSARAGDEPSRVRVGRDSEHRRRGLLGVSGTRPRRGRPRRTRRSPSTRSRTSTSATATSRSRRPLRRA